LAVVLSWGLAENCQRSNRDHHQAD
jgi:hypothetical protein